MADERRIFVSNIPVRACVDGWVTVPEETESEDLDKAIARSLKEHGFEPHQPSIEVTSSTEIDLGLLEKWEFTTPLEET